MIVTLSAGRDAPPELLARLALDTEGVRGILRLPRPGIRELVVLATCHRTEIYATADGPESDAIHAAVALLPALRPSDQTELRTMRGSEAIEHLFRVACGLDSLVVGEPQILGQVRGAFNLAREEGAVGPVLPNVFARAIKVGRAARAATPLGRLASSIGALTAEHLAARFQGLAGRHGAIVGAGEAAGDAAAALHAAGASLSVLGRSMHSVERLARTVHGDAYLLDQMPEILGISDFAVVATSGGVLVEPGHVPPRNGRGPLVLVDLSVPRSVDITDSADVEVQTLADLTFSQTEELQKAMVQAEAMVDEAMAEWERWLDARPAGHDVARLRMHAENLVRLEVAKAIGGMDLDEQEAERVAALSMRIARKLLHGPTVAMREGDEQTRALIHRLFDLEP